MWHMVASLLRSSKERPGDDVNFATSTTFNNSVRLVDVEDKVRMMIERDEETLTANS